MKRLVKLLMLPVLMLTCGIVLTACGSGGGGGGGNGGGGDTEPTTYTITWKNWDGAILQTNTLEQNQPVVFNGSKPTRNSSDNNIFVFTNWKSDNGNTVYWENSIAEGNNYASQDFTFIAEYRAFKAITYGTKNSAITFTDRFAYYTFTLTNDSTVDFEIDYTGGGTGYVYGTIYTDSTFNNAVNQTAFSAFSSSASNNLISLNAGAYYVVLDSNNNDGVATSAAVSILDPSNSFDTIAFGSDTEVVTLANSNVNKWFVFTLSELNSVSLTLIKTNGYYGFHVDLYSSSNFVTPVWTVESYDVTITHLKELPAGTYYVKMRNEYDNSSVAGKLHFKKQANNIANQETTPKLNSDEKVEVITNYTGNWYQIMTPIGDVAGNAAVEFNVKMTARSNDTGDSNALVEFFTPDDLINSIKTVTLTTLRYDEIHRIIAPMGRIFAKVSSDKTNEVVVVDLTAKIISMVNIGTEYAVETGTQYKFFAFTIQTGSVYAANISNSDLYIRVNLYNNEDEYISFTSTGMNYLAPGKYIARVTHGIDVTTKTETFQLYNFKTMGSTALARGVESSDIEITSATDEHWFNFTVSCDELVEVSTMNADYTYYRIYSETDLTAPLDVTGQVYYKLSQGTYYIKVGYNSSYDYDAMKPSSDYKIMWDDIPEFGNFETGTGVYYQQNVKLKYYYYRLVLTEESVITLSLKNGFFAGTHYSESYYTFAEVYYKGDLVNSITHEAKQEDTYTFALDAGEYILVAWTDTTNFDRYSQCGEFTVTKTAA